jgi:Cupin-like domain
MSDPQAGPTRVPIPEMSGFDRDTFDRDFRAPARPAVLRGAAALWTATRSWSPEAFAQRFGDVVITPSVNLPDTEVPYQFRDVDHRQTMTMADLVARMDAGDRCYIDQVVIGKYPGLENEFDFSAFGLPNVLALLVWIGSRTRSGLHYDYIDNFFAQVHGTKLAILAAPEDAPNLHVYDDAHTKSQVAPQHPDLRAHRRLKHATLFETNLEPGDVLYIPKGWWHYLASSDRSISLSCWHGTPLGTMYDVKLVWSTHRPGLWLRLVRDFFWYGLLRRPYQRRLYSPPPTGVMLYELVTGALKRKRS